MQSIICDSCNKPVRDAMRDVNYVTVLDKTLCLSCKDGFERRVASTMFSRKKYAFLDHKKVLSDTLHKVCK